jgi:hypothetical protein
MLVNSVPLSETKAAGLPPSAVIAAPTRGPESDVSATGQRHSRVKSSTMAWTRNRLPPLG